MDIPPTAPWDVVDKELYEEIVFEIDGIGVVTVPILRDENIRLRRALDDPRQYKKILENKWKVWEAERLTRFRAYRAEHPYNPAEDVFSRPFPAAAALAEPSLNADYADDPDDVELIETRVMPISTPRGVKRSSRGTVIPNLVSSETEFAGSVETSRQVQAPITPSGETQEPSSSNAKQPATFNWDDDAIQCMLSIRLPWEDRFLKSTTKQGILWQQVAKEMKACNKKYTLNGSAVSEKFRNMMKTYKENKARQAKTGEGVDCVRWAYFQQFDEVFGNRAKIVVPADQVASTISEAEGHSQQTNDEEQEQGEEQERKPKKKTGKLDDKNKSFKKGMTLPAYRKAKISIASAKLKEYEDHNKERRRIEEERTEAIRAAEKVKFDLMKAFLEKNQK